MLDELLIFIVRKFIAILIIQGVFSSSYIRGRVIIIIFISRLLIIGGINVWISNIVIINRLLLISIIAILLLKIIIIVFILYIIFFLEISIAIIVFMCLNVDTIADWVVILNWKIP